MRNYNSRLAIIHLAKKKLGLDEEAYRAILSGAGVYSAKDIETETQFNAIMSAFVNLGFLPSGHSVARGAIPDGRNGMITRPQEYYIKGLWVIASRAKDGKSLRRMIKRIGKVDDIRFLTRRDASAVILALRDICWKAGFNPDSKEGGAYAMDSKKNGTNTTSQPAICSLPHNSGGA